MSTTKTNYPLPNQWYVTSLGGGFEVLCYDLDEDLRWIISKCDERVEIPDTIYDKCELYLQKNEGETFLCFKCESVYEAFNIFQKSWISGKM